MQETFALFLVWTGCVLSLAGCLGLARIPGFYDRLQTAYTCLAGGVIAALLGTLVFFGVSAGGAKALIAAGLAAICIPTAANALAAAARRHEQNTMEKSE